MNLNVLDQKLRALKLYPRLKSPDIDRLGTLLPTLGEWDFVRINPYHFADAHGFEIESLLDVFIHGAKIGLFDFHFGQICPSCGGVEHTHSRLDAIHSDSVYCTVCSRLVESSMDDMIEVSFQPSESLGVGPIDPLRDILSYLRYFRSENLVEPSTGNGEIMGTMQSFSPVPADAKAMMSVTLEAGQSYRLMNMESHSQLVLDVDGEALNLEQVVDVDVLAGGFSPHQLTIRPGRVVFHLNNRYKSAIGVVFQQFSRFMALQMSATLGRSARIWRPFLTGKAFLNNQSFRELFRMQAWAPDMKLKIKNLTILFTDLKGSTDMYGRVGDITAYDVVQKHFDLLTEVVRDHRGAIVKTMGDAIMATFSNSQDGVLAAVSMVERMKTLNLSAGQTDLGIKIGVHEGAALAVNADERLDYFGQNINLAARVQGLAEAGEIWLTQDVYRADGVGEVVTASKMNAEPKMATLKGISSPTPVYRLWL